MSFANRVLANLFRQKARFDYYLFATSTHLNNTSKKTSEGSCSSHLGFSAKESFTQNGRSFLYIVGLAGFTLFVKNKLFSKAECEVDVKKEEKCENLQNQDALPFDVYFKEAKKKSKAILERVKRENNCPAITITVSVDGKEIWSEGIGLIDVENEIKCTKKSVFRIASISKSITMAVVGKLVEDGLLDLDLPVQYYVPEWPDKFYNGAKVDITTRQVVSMLSGIRDYELVNSSASDEKKTVKKRRRGDHKLDEFYINRPHTLTESLNLFKDDELCSLPGTKYLYSTHNWTLLSAVIEKVTGKKIEDVFQDLFDNLSLNDTHLDQNLQIVPYRARYYSTSSNGKLQNASPVDNSYKWAGGGLQATSSDVCRFGTAMLAFYQGVKYEKTEVETESTSVGPYLSRPTVEMIWTPVENTKCNWDKDGLYAMGWCSVPTRPTLSPRMAHETLVDHRRRQYFSHTGGAVGASSVLLVVPRDEESDGKSLWKEGRKPKRQSPDAPRGTVVAIVTNMQGVQLNPSALEIAVIFETEREYYVKNRLNFLNYFMDEDKNVDPELLLSLFYVHE